MAPRWKWKGAEAKALAEHISKTVSDLQFSLALTESSGFLSSSNVVLSVEPHQAELLDRGCFGRPIVCGEKHKRWIHLTFEEAFFLCYQLKCIKISFRGRFLTEVDLWRSIRSFKPSFASSYKAYSHLRLKNWIVRSGLQYGVNFVAYRHHPSLVHSEYAVLVLQSDDGNDRLKVWSDIHCSVRLTGSVAKTLLVLYVDGQVNKEDMNLPLCLEEYTVEAQVIRRWSPELSREDETRN